jgi:transcriptional regulator with XRE-family HTH domain
MGAAEGQGLRKVIAANVRRLRKARGFSQEGFADACGLHRTYIGGIERAERNVSVDNIERMADALSVPGWKLLHPTTGEPASA